MRHLAQGAHAARLVNIADGDPLGARIIAQQADQQRRTQAVAAKIDEEIILHTDAGGPAQHIGHGARNRAFHLADGRDDLAGCGLRQRQFGQMRPVKLAANGGGQRRD